MIFLLVFYIFGIFSLLITVRQRTLKGDLSWGIKGQEDVLGFIVTLAFIPVLNIVFTCIIWLDIYKVFSETTTRRTKIGRSIQNYFSKPLYKRILFIK